MSVNARTTVDAPKTDGWQVEAKPVPPELEQGYFATPSWQEGERQTEKELAAGEYVDFDTAEEAIAWLDSPDTTPAFAHGVQVIDRLDDTTRVKLGAKLRELLDNE